MRSAKWLAERITADIKAGTFGASGSFLPVQEILRKKYAVSNSTVVIARKNLEEQGLIETIGRSVFITNGRAHKDTPYMQKRNVSRTIAVLVPRFNSLFFSAFCDEISKQLQKNGYRALFVVCPEGQERETMKIVRQTGVDGIVAAVTDRKEIILMYEQLPLPCVLVGARGKSIRLSTIDEDPFDTARRIAQQFIREECKRFFVLRTNKYTISNDNRTNGFLQGLVEEKVCMKQENIIEIGENFHIGIREIIRRIRQTKEKAGVLIYNTIALPLFLEMCESTGIILHRDIEVASFLDVYRNEREKFPVVMAKTSIKSLAQCAGEEIIRQIEDDNATPQTFKIPYHIYWDGIQPK